LLLLAARQSRGSLEQAAHLPGRAATAPPRRFVVEELLDADAKSIGQSQELVWSQRNRVALPVRIGTLREPEFLGYLYLREPSLLAQCMKPRPKGRSRLARRSAGLHV